MSTTATIPSTEPAPAPEPPLPTAAEAIFEAVL
jgi:hypothetical protein